MAIDSKKQQIVTLEMIAARCGIHRSTVHRALHGKGRVDPVTVERVRLIAKEMGYDPVHNQAASRLIALRHGNRVLNRMVALFLPEIFYQHDFYLRILRGLLEVLVEERFDLMTTYLRQESDLLPHAILAGNVDGVIAISPNEFDSRLQALHASPNFGDRPVIPLIHPVTGCTQVLIDDRGGAAAACAHLLELGHRHILYHYFGTDSYNVQQRIAGYYDAYRNYNVDPATHLHRIAIDWNPFPGQHLDECIKQALHTYPQTTAILAPNDPYARRIRNILLNEGFRVPEDYSIIGFDDTEPIMDEMGRNILTTVRLPLEEIGRKGARMIIRQIQENTPPEETLILPTELIVRSSTCPPRG